MQSKEETRNETVRKGNCGNKQAEHDEALSVVWDESIKAGRQITEEYWEGREKVMEYKDFVEQVKEQIQDGAVMDGVLGQIAATLHNQDLQNMDVLQPYRFKRMRETIIEMMARDIARDNDMDISEAREMAPQLIPDVPDIMFVLTNDTKVNGVAPILNDDTRQEIADKVGDFYVLSSSIHEI